ncbi:PstA family ABC transporter permease [Candidatus Mesenet endosymbiont of Agriotes lineatus]|uniref:PstA family ABC transporter permease n=1 Tax=Candidatus Mesenet endosymbiont of Agriotes lineatus TaxID=3077948 RepID=UPI0030D2EF47
MRKKFIRLLKSRRIHARIKRKNRKDKLLRFGSLAILLTSLGFLLCILFSILINGYNALTVTKVLLPINTDTELLSTYDSIKLREECINLINNSLQKILQDVPFDAKKEILSYSAHVELARFLKQSTKTGKYEIWFTASSTINAINKRQYVDNEYYQIFSKLKAEKRVGRFFNKSLFLKSDSQEPETAGILGSLLGSLLTVAACLLFAIPIGVMAGIGINEFMPKGNIFTNIIEISINNLAAVPAIIFGIVGFTIYLNIFGLPRSSPLVGGMTLSLMMLPNLIIATKHAFASVPTTIKDAAFALGASHMQVILHHSLPIALPRIIQATILAVARILGESSPLLMIGMVAFIADVPLGFFDPSTTLPVQIYIWSSNPKAAFMELAAVAIICLLLILLMLNLIAHYFKKKFDSFTF